MIHLDLTYKMSRSDCLKSFCQKCSFWWLYFTLKCWKWRMASLKTIVVEMEMNEVRVLWSANLKTWQKCLHWTNYDRIFIKIIATCGCQRWRYIRITLKKCLEKIWRYFQNMITMYLSRLLAPLQMKEIQGAKMRPAFWLQIMPLNLKLWWFYDCNPYIDKLVPRKNDRLQKFDPKLVSFAKKMTSETVKR